MSKGGVKKSETINPATKELMDIYIKQIFEAAVIYRKFEDNLKKINESGENVEGEKIYMITRDFLDNFREKINYNEIRDCFTDEGNQENFYKFEEKLSNLTYDDLELIVLGEFNIYGDLEKIEEDYQKGFDFVNEEFLDKLDFSLEDNMKDSNVNIYKEKNNIIVMFSDRSKLLIYENKGNYKYSAIPSSIREIQKISAIKKNKTFKITNKNNIPTS